MFFFFYLGHDCVTPSQVVTTLKSNGGLHNCSVELVRLNREKLAGIDTDFASLDSKLKKFVGRSNDIIFKYDEPPQTLRCVQTNYASDYSTTPTYAMQVFKHSGKEY